MSLPSFLVVGAPKAGTTTLYHHLRSHPDVFMSATKEPHYFSYTGEGRPSWGVQTLGDYQALFADVSGETAIGEASTWYLYSETAAEQIHRVVPDAQIIVLLRDPIARAYSSWSYNTQNGWEGESFEAALELEESRRAQGKTWDVRYLDAGRYARQVERYLDRFGSDQMRVLLFEDLVLDPAPVVSKVFQFLGVDPEATTIETDRVHNATAMPRWAGLTRFLKRGSVRSASRLVPSSARRALAAAVRQTNRQPRARLDAQVRHDLQDQLRPDVRRLGDLLGRDLEQRWFDERPQAVDSQSAAR